MTIRDFVRLDSDSDATLVACNKLSEEAGAIAILEGDGSSTAGRWDPWT